MTTRLSDCFRFLSCEAVNPSCHLLPYLLPYLCSRMVANKSERGKTVLAGNPKHFQDVADSSERERIRLRRTSLPPKISPASGYRKARSEYRDCARGGGTAAASCRFHQLRIHRAHGAAASALRCACGHARSACRRGSHSSAGSSSPDRPRNRRARQHHRGDESTQTPPATAGR